MKVKVQTLSLRWHATEMDRLSTVAKVYNLCWKEETAKYAHDGYWWFWWTNGKINGIKLSKDMFLLFPRVTNLSKDKWVCNIFPEKMIDDVSFSLSND